RYLSAMRSDSPPESSSITTTSRGFSPPAEPLRDLQPEPQAFCDPTEMECLNIDSIRLALRGCESAEIRENVMKAARGLCEDVAAKITLMHGKWEATQMEMRSKLESAMDTIAILQDEVARIKAASASPISSKPESSPPSKLPSPPVREPLKSISPHRTSSTSPSDQTKSTSDPETAERSPLSTAIPLPTKLPASTSISIVRDH
ncbi:unnamed protein product, partial [Cyprideis torosa]